MTEIPVVFGCEGEELVGIVSAPASPAEHGVLIIVGGPQYRVGSHRQFVHLARHLASTGVAAMRFDVRGMGDSSGAWRLFEDIDADIGAALDALQRTVPSLRSVTLWGLCGGASAALLYSLGRKDRRVGAMVLVNPWLRTETVEARARVKHYYVQRLLQGAFWRKLLSGQVARSAVTELLRSLKLVARSNVGGGNGRAGFGEAELGRRMASGWAGFGGEILLVLSENDHTAKEFIEAAKIDDQWQRNLVRPNVRRLDLAEADHTFTDPAARDAVERASGEVARRAPPGSGGGAKARSAAESST